jgi:hypothetical protein
VSTLSGSTKEESVAQNRNTCCGCLSNTLRSDDSFVSLISNSLSIDSSFVLPLSVLTNTTPQVFLYLVLTSDATIEDAKHRWKTGDCPLMLGQAGSMGHGLDGLQYSGNIIVWFGLNWSLDLYMQILLQL